MRFSLILDALASFESDSRLPQRVASSLARVTIAVAALSLVGSACRDETTSSTGHSTSATSASGAGGSGGDAPVGGPIKILDWNTRDFYDDQKDSSLADEEVLTPAEYQTKLSQVSKVVGQLDPDIAVFAEVENQTVIDALNAKLGNAYSEAHVIDGNDPRGIDVGILSKIPLTSIVSHKADAFTANGTQSPTYHYSRDCVEYHFQKGSQKFIILGVHFKSKADPDDPQKRLAEAQHTHGLAEGLANADLSAAILVTGDFNDDPSSPTFAAIAGDAGNFFTDAPSFMPPADAWSYLFMGMHELIDHQMGNPNMTALIDKASVTILHGADVDAASDHDPVMATYVAP